MQQAGTIHGTFVIPVSLVLPSCYSQDPAPKSPFNVIAVSNSHLLEPSLFHIFWESEALVSAFFHITCVVSVTQ